MIKLLQVIFDTSVIISAIRSKRGASYKLFLQLATEARWQINLSTALLLEYEAKAREHAAKFGYTSEQLMIFWISFARLPTNTKFIFAGDFFCRMPVTSSSSN